MYMHSLISIDICRIKGVLLFHGEITPNAVVISGKGDYIEHPEPSPAYAPCN